MVAVQTEPYVTVLMFQSGEHTNVLHARVIESLPFSEKVDRENNKDYNQVLLDVQRSLRRFPPGELKSYHPLDHIFTAKHTLLDLYLCHIIL